MLVVRNHETGQWSQPGFYTVSSLSLGPQIGGQAAGVMMIVRTERALTRLFRSSVKLGGDTSVALGPVGVGVRSAVTADIVTFARSRGAYVGVSLQGSMIRVRSGWNEAYFGRPVRPVDIFVKENVRNPGADKLIRTISKTELKVQR